VYFVLLNASAFCGIGGAFMGYLGGACEVLWGNRGCLGCILCLKRLRLSWKLDERKSLPWARGGRRVPRAGAPGCSGAN